MPIRPENRDRYPADWKLRSRFVIHVRAGDCCEWCGVRNGSLILPLRCCSQPMFGDEQIRCDSCRKRLPRVVLTTAHVYDDRPEVSSLLNLAALCQKCHNRHDNKERARRRRERLDHINGVQLLPFEVPSCL